MQSQIQKPISRRFCTPARSGVTILEVFVVLAIVGLLLALAMPAIQKSRESARKAECQNNLREIGLGMQLYADNHNGHLPELGISNGEPAERRSWITQIFPFIEQSTLWEQMLIDPAFDPGTHVVPLLTCPSDMTARNVPGALSYAGNGGTIDNSYKPPCILPPIKKDPIIQGAPLSVTYQLAISPTEGTGIFPPGEGLRIQQIESRDGASNTLLAVDNIFAGFWSDYVYYSDAEIAAHPCFQTPIVPWTAYSAPVLIIIGDDGIQYDGDETAAEDYEHGPATLGFAAIDLDQYAINEGVRWEWGGIEGRLPAPNSLHPQGVNALFVSGRVRFINENIDDAVYLQLMSWKGQDDGQGLLVPGSY